ncbi:hypothetical protein ABKN59_012021, partial [Abortiporus biennis]
CLSISFLRQLALYQRVSSTILLFSSSVPGHSSELSIFTLSIEASTNHEFTTTMHSCSPAYCAYGLDRSSSIGTQDTR